MHQEMNVILEFNIQLLKSTFGAMALIETFCSSLINLGKGTNERRVNLYDVKLKYNVI